MMKSQKKALIQNKNTIRYEIETTEGLEMVTWKRELSLIRRDIIWDIKQHIGAITCRCVDVHQLLNLKTAVAIYQSDFYPIPRPKALLGHQHFTRMLEAINNAIGLMPSGAKTFYLSAAGDDSSVMTRIKQEITHATGLIEAEQGDLFLRIRRAEGGWDVLTRLSDRPLATRVWRVCNMQGAINAPLAHAMILLSVPKASDKFLNVACGSGTFLIERLIHGGVAHITGCDISESALECAKENIAKAGYNQHISLSLASGMQLPYTDNMFTVICADLPFGQLVGNHHQNVQSYPMLLQEMARVLAKGGRAVIISHELRLMDSLVTKEHQNALKWHLTNTYQITQRGLHPRIYIFQK